MAETSAVYLHVNIQLVRGKERVYMEAMASFAQMLESEYGWRLIGGFQSGIGRLGHVVHLWRVPSADAIAETLTSVRQTQPAIREWAEAFAESIESEALEVMHPTGYSPTP